MDDDFEPHLGRPADRPGTRRYLNQVIRAARRAGGRGGARRGRFDGSRIGRGAARARVLASGDRHAAFRSRRVVVKARLSMLAGKGAGGGTRMAAARAHLRYIERDGVNRDGTPGQLYGAQEDQADREAFLDRSDGDRHQFRFIVSAEDGDQYEDLKPLTRRLMQQMEEDLGTKLDWVAVDHYNTGHPHTHIVLRGKDDRGQNLIIAREYISSGMREQAMRIVTMDLGPRTDLEIAERLARDVEAERLTAIDRQLLRDMDDARVTLATGSRGVEQSQRVGRLRKLEAMGLAEHVEGPRWRLAEGLEDTLRRMGERGDIIRTMQRELSARNVERASVDQRVFDPAAIGAQPITGRVIMRGLADELEDRHFVIVDGVDGRSHYVAIGKGEATELLPAGAVVRVTPRDGGIRPADRTIVEVAAAHGGHYGVEAHLRHDPGATEAFAQAHVRRLEAMRRAMRTIEREDDGSWVIAPDHLEKVAVFEARQLRDRPVTVDLLAAGSLARLAREDAPTWLDRELASAQPVALREAGFGQEVRGALDMRRQWLVEQELASERNGELHLRADMLAVLQRRELLRVAGVLSEELELPFAEIGPGQRIEGKLLRTIELAGGRHALVERSRDFTLVPWRPVLEKRIGQSVSGIMREGSISWSFGRDRGGPTIP
nr:relaxase/mobilization nuclease RlxS [Novosphingobium rosa]